MQDLYLLLRGLYDGGFAVSVTVQATPSKESAPSPLGTAEQFGSWIKECQATEWRLCSGVLLPCSKSTTPSSKQSASYDDGYIDGMLASETFWEATCNWCKAEPKRGCLGKLQEGSGSDNYHPMLIDDELQEGRQ